MLETPLRDDYPLVNITGDKFYTYFPVIEKYLVVVMTRQSYIGVCEINIQQYTEPLSVRKGTTAQREICLADLD